MLISLLDSLKYAHEVLYDSVLMASIFLKLIFY